MENIFIRLEEVSLDIDHNEDELSKKVANILGIAIEKINDLTVVKRAVDSRNRGKINFVYSADVLVDNPDKIVEKISKFHDKTVKRHRIRLQEAYVYEIPSVTVKSTDKRPIIIGSGPSGLFCALLMARAGLKPLIIERGKCVDKRVNDVNKFFNTGELNVNSNIQFGEGGAGTFSDGKLNTLIKNSRIKYIFNEFLLAGAPEDIAWQGHPHIGTDKLREVVKNMSKEIVNLGGEIRFESCLTNIGMKNGKIVSAIINDCEEIFTNELVLAIGHSARDTYEMLFENGVKMEQKVFSIGVRIEHKAKMINKAQYKDFYNSPKLPTARYKLVANSEGNRPVYTFCMCPGGYVVAAASEKGMLVTNGMSEYNQDGENSNSALLVNVFPEDIASDHSLAGIEFQRKWEKKAFEAGGRDFKAPAVLVSDFLNDRKSVEIADVKATYKPGIVLGSLDGCLPDYVLESIRGALPFLDRKVKGFAHPEALITGVETRTTAPVRLIRDESFQSNIAGLYPAGEGAGYAGGIISSAVDGIRIAEVIIEKYV